MAQEHLKRDPALSSNLHYKCCTTDNLLQDSNMADDGNMEGTFDCVVASEVVEHVRNVDIFVGHLSRLVKVEGCPLYQIYLCMSVTHIISGP